MSEAACRSSRPLMRGGCGATHLADRLTRSALPKALYSVLSLGFSNDLPNKNVRAAMSLKLNRSSSFASRLRSLGRRELVAVESSSEIRAAVTDWENKFRLGAEKRVGFSGSVWLHPAIGTWAHFTRLSNGLHYWIPFGRSKSRFRETMIVEINPPIEGKRHVQGVIAVDSDNRRWVLHGGRLHPRGARVTEEMFDAVYDGQRVTVLFSDDDRLEYHPVACLDGSVSELQSDISEFVGACQIIRTYYTQGPAAAALEKHVEEAERGHPESDEPYMRGPQDAQVIERKHGKIWKALSSHLKRMSIEHNNNRVGRWGPDLVTLEAPHMLFEIKCDIQASDIQRGLGQLLLYESMLEKPHRKVLLLPENPQSDIMPHLTALNVEVSVYKAKGDAITFPSLQKRFLTA